jgi:tRNA G37 N-methylase Trm5
VVQDYLTYIPKSQDPEVQRLWKKLVQEPVHNAVNRYQPVLRKHKMLDQVFRLTDLDVLVDRLEPLNP